MAEKAPINVNKLIRNIIRAVVIALVIFILWYFMTVTMFIVCGLILSLITRPLYILLEKIRIRKRKIPSSINAFVAILVVWAVLGGIAALTVPLIIKEAVKVSKTDPEKLISQLEKPINGFVKEMEMLGMLSFDESDTILEKTNVHTVDRIIVYKLPCDSIYNSVYNHGGIFDPEVDTLIKTTKTVPDQTIIDTTKAGGIYHRNELEGMIKKYGIEHVSIQKVGKWFGDAFTAIGNMLATIVSASFLAFFLLRDKDLLEKIVIAVMPRKYEKQTMAILHDSRKMLSRYFIGLVLELILVMLCTTIGLLIIGLNFQLAVTIGFFCGLFNIIPYLGPIIGAAVGLMLGIANFLDLDVYTYILPMMGKMLIVFAIVQVLDNNIFQTVIFSNSVKAHPIEIFLVIVIAGSLAGVVGMIFAVPVYTVLRVIGRHFFSQFRIVRSLTQNMD